MRVGLTRSGGFAGMTLSREIELSSQQLEQLLASSGASTNPSPDAFSYEITVNGETFTVAGESTAPLLEKLLRAE